MIDNILKSLFTADLKLADISWHLEFQGFVISREKLEAMLNRLLELNCVSMQEAYFCITPFGRGQMKMGGFSDESILFMYFPVEEPPFYMKMLGKT